MKINKNSIKNQIKEHSGLSVKEFLIDQKSKNKSLKDIADLFGCHEASISRLGTDNNVSFARSPKSVINYIHQTKAFQERLLNSINVLSRGWIKA